MKLIENVTIREVPGRTRDEMIYDMRLNQDVTRWREEEDLIQVIIKGQQFTNNNGEEMIIGISDKASKTLGIALNAWEEQENFIEYLQKENSELQCKCFELEEIKSFGFWDKVRYLFKRNEVKE